MDPPLLLLSFLPFFHSKEVEDGCRWLCPRIQTSEPLFLCLLLLSVFILKNTLFVYRAQERLWRRSGGTGHEIDCFSVSR